MRGTSQESNRAPGRESRSGTDPRLEALQQVRQSANIRESGLWDRGGRQQAPNYYTLQTPASDTSNMLDMKEKISYQQRMFSQPPGYIAPPPYDSPHKGSPVLNQCDVSWEQEGKRQTYLSQPKLRKQDVCVDLQEKKQFIKQAGMLKSFRELEGLKHKQKETGALQARSHFSAQETHMQHEGMSYLQQPQVLQAVENTKINKEEPYSKVIEGRKFRLNKKTGGLTIFCLVSRIAGTTETPSLPLCSLQTNTELRSVSKGIWDNSGYNQKHKIADEVDFRATTPTEQSNTSDATKREAPTCVESEMLEDTIAKTDLFPAEAQTNSFDSAFGRQVAQSLPVKYPLWREPIFSSRTETERSSTCYKADSEDRESDVLLNQGESGEVHPIDVEVRKLDIKKNPQSEDSNNPLLIDATCICLQMEQIPSPKEEHVLYLLTQHSPLQSTASTECFESNSQMDKDDLNTEPKPFHINDMFKNEFDSDPMEKKAPEEESIISSLGMSFSSVFEKETLEERAERILGIPLLDCIIMQQPEDASSLLGFCVENQEVKPSTIKDTDIDEQIPDDQREEEPNQFEAVKTEVDVCSQENDVANDQADIEDGRGCAGPQDQVSNTSQENNIDSQLKSDIKALSAIEMTENPLKPVTTEPEEKDTSPHYPSQCLWPFNDLSNSSLCSHIPDFEAPSPDPPLMLSSSDPTHLLHISNSEIEEGPDPELIALNSAESHAPCSENSSLSPASTDFPPTPSPLDFIIQTTESVSDIEVQDEEGETSQLIHEISDTFEDVAKEITEEIVSQQQVESGQTDDAASVKESDVTDEQQTKEADKSPTDPIMEQTVEPTQENAEEVDILQQQLECFQVEDVACVKDMCMTEEQLPEEVNEDPTDCLDQSISQEHVTDSETRTEALQQTFDNGQEKDSYIQESLMTEEQSHKDADEDPTDLQEQTQSTENDSQSQIEIKMDIQPHSEPFHSSPPSPSDSGCEVSQSASDVLSPSELSSTPNTSNKTDSEFDSLLEMSSVCPSALNPDAATAAGIQEIVPPPLHLDSCEEPLEFSSSSCTDSPSVLPSSSSSLHPQEESGSYDPDLTLKEKPEYPMSLWDAVNRIRKHTAPDSENEEEEVSELWDPENGGEDLGLPDVVVGIKSSKRIVIDGSWQHNALTAGSGEDVEVEQIHEDLRPEEPSAYVEEDTLSCSSFSSHGSGDTVIEAEEDEFEETPLDDGTESKTGDGDRFQVAEEEQCSCAEVKGAAKETYPMEVENIASRAVEMTETGPEENDSVVFMTSEVSDQAIIEIESVKENVNNVIIFN